MQFDRSQEPGLPPVVPAVPALNMLEQFASPAGVGAVLQTAASALNGASSMVGGAPATLPVSPIAGVPATAPGTLPATLPGTAPVAPVAAPTGVGSTLVPLLDQIGIPASLVNLAPTDLPFPLGNNAATPTAPITAPITAPLTAPITAPVTAPLTAPFPAAAPASPLSALP